MNKNLKKIIIPLLVLSILLAPISPILKNNSGNLALGININEANAFMVDSAAAATSKASSDFTALITTDNVTSGSVDVTTVLRSTRDGAYWAYLNKHIQTGGVSRNSTMQIEISEADDPTFSKDFKDNFHPQWKTLGYDQKTAGDLTLGSITDQVASPDSTITLKNTFGDLEPQKTYYLRFVIEDENGDDVDITTNSPKPTITTLASGTGGTPKDSAEITNTKILDFDCGVIVDGSVAGCLAELSYTLYGVSAWIAESAGKFLDFFVYYSTNSTSYTNDFINKAFGAIRDVANVFFIIALLYVAIKTILDLNVTNNKKLIGTIVVVALLINFSLFFTQVIIDGTNILAKVFYNQTTGVDENGTALTGAGGQKSISVGLVAKVNPQKILTAGAGSDAQTYYQDNKGRFIFIALLAVFIALYMAYIFFMVALLFVGRVIALWLSMIFAPLAFASYTMPFEIPGFGHKAWWDELLKNAFLAPIFIFFLYIIIMFAGFLSTIVSYPTSTDTVQNLMSVVIPFAVLMILLMKAKEMAVKFSGEMGKAMTSITKTVGGFVGGAALGAVAFGGTKVIGGIASSVANSDTLREKAAAGDKGAQRTLARANYLSKKSFDFRQTGAGKLLQKQSGFDLNAGTGALGISTEKLKGGQKARFERKVEKEEEKVKSYEMTPSAARTQKERSETYKKEKENEEKSTTQKSKTWSTEYEKSKKEAEEKSNTSSSAEKETWDKEYQQNLTAAKSKNTVRGFTNFDEKKFKEDYEKMHPAPMSSFNEKEFKETYEKQNPPPKAFDEIEFKKNYTEERGLNTHDVDTPESINANRRQAYALSQEHPNAKKDENGNYIKGEDGKYVMEDTKTTIRNFLKEFRSGMKDMVMPGGGLGTTALAAAVTGGVVGAAIAIPVGGLVHAIKAMIPANKELVGRIAKGKSGDQKIIEMLKKMKTGDEAGTKKIVAELTKEEGKGGGEHH